MDIFAGGHSFVCGRTGTGKTTFVVNKLKEVYKPVLFFNIQGYDTGFVRVDGRYDVRDVIKALWRGCKLDFELNANISFAKIQVDYIIENLFRKDVFREDRGVYIVFDEAQLLAPESQKLKNAIINMIPTRGRVHGLFGIFVTQRPALVDKTIVTQCAKHVIFQTEYEESYFRSKGLDSEKIRSMLGDEEHAYIIYEKGQYAGPYKEVLE